MGIEEVVREEYTFTLDHRFPEFYPPDFRRVRGLIDMHVHSGPMRQHPYALGKHASRAGMRAIVLKYPALGNTVAVVHMLQEVLREWAVDNGVTPTEFLGSLVLGHNSRLLNPEYAAQVIALGARVIWFPVRTAANFLERGRGMPAEEARKRGIYVVEQDHLITEAEEILDLVKETGVAVSFGHLSKQEMFALADGCRRRDITRAFIDHPFSPVADLSIAEMVQIARMGITINFTRWELTGYCGIAAQTMVRAIREIGTNKTTLSSDSSSEIFSDSVECMRLHAAMLDVYGFSSEDQHKLLCGNQQHILRIEPYAQATATVS